eukprot:4542822-Amphidinium_carterae.1
METEQVCYGVASACDCNNKSPIYRIDITITMESFDYNHRLGLQLQFPTFGEYFHYLADARTIVLAVWLSWVVYSCLTTQSKH